MDTTMPSVYAKRDSYFRDGWSIISNDYYYMAMHGGSMHYISENYQATENWILAAIGRNAVTSIELPTGYGAW